MTDVRKPPDVPTGPAGRTPDDRPVHRSNARAGTRVHPRRVSTRELLGDDGILWIEHEGEVYTLRRTRAGRLILTK